MLDWILTFAALAALAGLAVFANWRAGQPWNDLKPRRLPWRVIMIAAVFGLVVALVHAVNLLGVDTGPENSLFRR